MIFMHKHIPTQNPYTKRCYKFQETDKSNIKILHKRKNPFPNSTYENTILVALNEEQSAFFA